MTNKQVKLQAFEYALFKMIEWYIDVNNEPDFNSFFRRNNFSKEKVLLLPFFICTANSNREQMFGFFDKFYAAPFGHAEVDITESIYQMCYLAMANDVLTPKQEFIANYGYKKRIGNEIESYCGKNELSFYADLDHAIDALKGRDNEFICFDAETLKYYSKRHISWQMFSAISRKYQKPVTIPLEILINERSMFAESADRRILV